MHRQRCPLTLAILHDDRQELGRSGVIRRPLGEEVSWDLPQLESLGELSRAFDHVTAAHEDAPFPIWLQLSIVQMFFFWQRVEAGFGITRQPGTGRDDPRLNRGRASTGADPAHDILGTLERRTVTRFSRSKLWPFRSIISRRVPDWSESFP